MKKLLFLPFLLIQTCFCMSQTDTTKTEYLKKSSLHKLHLVIGNEEAEALAQYDWENGFPVLLLQSGNAPIHYSTDTVFEEKYKIRYFDYGCTGPNKEKIKAYNSIIFKRLTEKYGKKWRKTVRKDALGFGKRKMK